MKDDPIIGPVWVTKWALSTGVIRVDRARHCVRTSKDMINIGGGRYVHTPHWQMTEEAAGARVVAMIFNKRKSLARQVDKLGKLEKAIRAGELPVKREDGAA